MTLKSDISADNISVANFEITRELDQKVTFSSRFDYPKILGRTNLPGAIQVTEQYSFFDGITDLLTSSGNVIAVFVAATGSGFKETSIAAPNVDQFIPSSQIIPHVYVRIKGVQNVDPNIWRPLNGGFIFRYIRRPVGAQYGNVYSANNDQGNAGYFGGQFVYSQYSGGVLKIGVGMQLGYRAAGPGGTAGIQISLGEIYDIYYGKGHERSPNTTKQWFFTANVEIDAYVVWVY